MPFCVRSPSLQSYTIRIALRGHAAQHIPQPTHIDVSCIGKSYGSSWEKALCGHASPAIQIPWSHLSGWHLSKSIDGTGFMSISSTVGNNSGLISCNGITSASRSLSKAAKLPLPPGCIGPRYCYSLDVSGARDAVPPSHPLYLTFPDLALRLLPYSSFNNWASMAFALSIS